VEIRVNERRVIVTGLSFLSKIDAVEFKLQANGGIINLWNNNWRKMFRQMQSELDYEKSRSKTCTLEGSNATAYCCSAKQVLHYHGKKGCTCNSVGKIILRKQRNYNEIRTRINNKMMGI
jgi:hypothetical protein